MLKIKPPERLFKAREMVTADMHHCGAGWFKLMKEIGKAVGKEDLVGIATLVHTNDPITGQFGLQINRHTIIGFAGDELRLIAENARQSLSFSIRCATQCFFLRAADSSRWQRAFLDSDTASKLDLEFVRSVNSGLFDAAKLLVLLGADVNNGIEFGSAERFLSGVFFEPDFLRFMLAMGWKAEVSDQNGNGPFQFAAISESSMANIGILLDHGIKMKPGDGMRAGYTAASTGNLKLLERLRGAGFNFNTHDSLGTTVGHVAASNGQLECLRFIARSGWNVNSIDIKGNSAASYAIMHGLTDCVQLLLNYGLNVDREVSGFALAHGLKMPHNPVLDALAWPLRTLKQFGKQADGDAAANSGQEKK